MSRSKRHPRGNAVEHAMARTLDQLALLDDINKEILPVLRQAIKERWPREKLYKHPQVEALMAARAITIALNDPDSSKASTMIKSIEDRVEGKATEKKTVEHKYAKLKDEELDALVLSEVESDPKH